MTNDLKKASQSERIARFQSISAGLYWRALCDIPEFAITEGMVLLIESIRYVDNAPHTIIVRAHPDNYERSIWVVTTDSEGKETKRTITCTTHRFLTQDFLEKFEFEPGHEEIRANEVATIQQEITALQVEMTEAQTNPAILEKAVEDTLREDAKKEAAKAENSDDSPAPENLPALPDEALATAASGSLAEVIGSGITEATVGALKDAAAREHRIATIKSDWLQSKTGQIATKIQAMTPYYKEQAAAALARTEDVREYVDKLMKGIESLDLYTGKDVHVDTICEGASAPASEPLTCVQAKLSMEEELAIWADLDERFDHHDQNLFFKALSDHPDLVNQVFPTERCIVLMDTTTRLIDYGNDPIVNGIHNRENRKVFLMVRDGVNIYRVVSSVESHLNAGRLFPSKDENDRIFQGIDGSRITLQDVTYTDRLARHESAVLHYKRFLILLCGLDHRLELFGDFYEGPRDFSFVTAEFQEKHIRFIHDDDGEGMLPEEQRPDFSTYIKSLNSSLQSGSRVLCIWDDLMNPNTSPSTCFAYGYGDHRSYDQKYSPDDQQNVAIAQRAGTDIFVKVQVSGRNRDWEQRIFDAKVYLRKEKKPTHWADMWDTRGLPFLCLDQADPDLLEWYIYNRKTRKYHLSYIKTFKRAVAILRAERAKEKATRARMMSAIIDNNIASEAQAGSIIDQAVAAWRASNRGADLPDFDTGNGSPRQWKSLLDQMYLLAGAGEDHAEAILKFASENGLEPLRVSLTGNGVMLLYAAPSAADRDDRAEPFVWVRRITTKAAKDGVSISSERWALLEATPPGETIIREFDAVQDWIGKTSVFTSPMQKADALARTEKFANYLAPFTKTGSKSEREDLLTIWDETRNKQNETGKYVTEPSMAIPMGLVVRDREAWYICIAADSPNAMLARHADNSFVEHALALHTQLYQNKSNARRNIEQAVQKAKWKVAVIPVKDFSRDHDKIFLGSSALHGHLNPHHHEMLDPRMTPLVQELQRKDSSIWLAPQATSKDGTLVADDMLDLELPDNFAPVEIRDIRITQRRTGFEVLRWFDVIPHEMIESYDIKSPDGHGMHSTGIGSYLNLEAALEAITKRLEARPGMAQTDSPKAPLPLLEAPTGVTRIYYEEVMAGSISQ